MFGRLEGEWGGDVDREVRERVLMFAIKRTDCLILEFIAEGRRYLGYCVSERRGKKNGNK